MKKILTTIVSLLFLILSVYSQDYKKVRTLFILSQAGSYQKLEEAKTEIDKILTDPKALDKAETYALKAEVYGTIAGNNVLGPKYPGAALEGYQALQKYLLMEPNETILKDDRYMGVDPLYSFFYKEGIKFYNEKKWDSALEKFKYTAEIGDLFSARKWSTSTFDTTAYLLAGASAQNAQKNEEAAKYYSKIADNKVSGKDYESVYDYLSKYYLTTNNVENFTKYNNLAKQAYPTNTLWSDLEFSFAAENMSLEEVVNKYEQGTSANTLTVSNYLDYGDYFINNKKVKALSPEKKAIYTEKAYMSFSKAATLDTANGIASFNAGVAAYTDFDESFEAARKIKGITPAIKANRLQADKVADAGAEKAIQWLEKSYATLSAKQNRTSIERSVLNKGVDLLYNLYEYKKDRSRGANTQNFDRFEAKAKFYDGKHGSFDKLIPNATNISQQQNTNTSSLPQGQIKLTKIGGVYTLKSIVNGLSLNMIFDTGASDVTISLTEALFMLKNGYLSKSDILGSAKYQTADGKISEGTTINLREIVIGGFSLRDVKASVVSSLDAPILLGQTVLKRFGTIKIDNNNQLLIIE